MDSAAQQIDAVAGGMDRLLTAYEVVVILGLDGPDTTEPMATLRKWRQLGELPGVELKVGNRVRFKYRREDVEAFIRRRRRPAVGP